jgi:ATP-dependent Clp protease adapter protein ClpS
VLLYAGPDLAIGHAVEALLGTVPALTEDEAVEVVAQAQALGAAQVAICLRELAEYYCERLSRQGLQCAIELV